MRRCPTPSGRKLAQAPALSGESLLDGTFFEDAEEYLLDQFPLRDGFRTGKALYTFGVMRALDNNGIFLHDGGVYKLEYPLQEQQVAYAAQLMERLCAELLTEDNRAVLRRDPRQKLLCGCAEWLPGAGLRPPVCADAERRS